MSFFGTDNRPLNSTQQGLVSNPTTGTLLAEVDFNDTMAHINPSTQVTMPVQVQWMIGNQTTQVVFLCDHALSTGLGATGIITQRVLPMSSAQSAQFQSFHDVRQGDRFRIRIETSVTGSVSGSISALVVF